MTKKILTTLEIDDANLDAAQAKADKLLATLTEIEARIDRINSKQMAFPKEIKPNETFTLDVGQPFRWDWRLATGGLSQRD